MQNTNEVDDLKRHDIPRHRVEKVHCTSLCPKALVILEMKNSEIYYLAVLDCVTFRGQYSQRERSRTRMSWPYLLLTIKCWKTEACTPFHAGHLFAL